MKKLLLLCFSLITVTCFGQKPNKANIEGAIRKTWEKEASYSSPKQTVTIHSIKIGSSSKVNLQDRIDGIPPNALITTAEVDFTVRTHYSDQVMATHRVMTVKVYKDQFNEWAAMNNGVRVTETKYEPKG